MAFYTEPTHYEKTALSDLQGAWENLRAAVVEARPFPDWERLLFHIDEGMSWESVRNLEHMRKALLLIQNLAAQSTVPAEVSEWVGMVRENLEVVFDAIAKGEVV
jgi:hypothetical protein